jgi:hypothetical protein
MNDYTLMMVRTRAEQMMREAKRDRLAARARRAARTRQTVPAVRAARRPAHWLASAAVRLRPTVTGR